ncbi:Septum formation protein Maf [bioreactor metagenome]|jgi:septum formation protein|uniref:Septum formation protein Maf n=1 Tax=bioreactor metagenome TaxID=1076179 RepID=A0A644US04_9ZZZZ|nr:Maf-like protein [Paludibacter sp.]
MLDNLKKYKIVLGSASPRRQELLRGINLNFEVLPMNVDESYPPDLNGVEIPMYLAEKKADAYKNMLNDELMVITADTIVFLDGKVLGKPVDKADAFKMLQRLSGKTHQVITGVCISTNLRRRTFHTISEVKFARLNDAEIDYYLEHYAPYDKAGSYGVQEWIGFIAVEQINGSYFNVMGLPIQRLYNELKRW